MRLFRRCLVATMHGCVSAPLITVVHPGTHVLNTRCLKQIISESQTSVEIDAYTGGYTNLRCACNRMFEGEGIYSRPVSHCLKPNKRRRADLISQHLISSHQSLLYTTNIAHIKNVLKGCRYHLHARARRNRNSRPGYFEHERQIPLESQMLW